MTDPGDPVRPVERSGPPSPDAIDHAVSRSLRRQSAAANELGARLVSVAIELLRTVGGAFSIDDVVRRADVSRRAFYRCFDGKNELLLAAFETLAAEREQLLEQVALAPAVEPLERVERLVRVRWDWVETLTRPQAFAIATLFPALRPQATVRFDLSVRHLHDRLATALADCQRAGLLRPSLLSVGELASMITLTTTAALTERVLRLPVGGDLDVPPDERSYARLWEYVRQTVVAG